MSVAHRDMHCIPLFVWATALLLLVGPSSGVRDSAFDTAFKELKTDLAVDPFIAQQPLPKNYKGSHDHREDIRPAGHCSLGYLQGDNKCRADEFECGVADVCGLINKDEVKACCCRDKMTVRVGDQCVDRRTAKLGPYSNEQMDGCDFKAQRNEQGKCECISGHILWEQYKCVPKCDHRSTGKRDKDGNCIKISYEGIPKAGGFLKRLSKYVVTGERHLNLSGMRMGPGGLENLAMALSTNPVLYTLDLRDAGLGPHEMKVLGPVLAQYRTLEELYLTGNEIGHEGAVALADALKHMRTDLVVQLGDDDVPNSGDQEILKAANTNIRFIIES
eukprot:gnl/TRDRNA2_/TRDRNA2_83072_c0_seq1.p1 gnl/TRDRNA2_/TRDRNA2_83072_c0~~gnl/TRDRNA2_/TRDRNA2_83072_c0_seq1.p1  ORF type:complete len:332 (+),score=52.63 gnl/TRDRNA2_/TRDRNA2_83072_c0_seq1:54-1049(+)